MAVDTASKRFSMLNHSWLPPVVGPVPDGAVGAGNRAHYLNLYNGIALDVPAVVVPHATYFVSAVDTSHVVSVVKTNYRAASVKTNYHVRG